MKQALRTFWRSLRAHPGHTAIHLVGFAVALMFVILVGLYIQDEWSVDRHHLHADRIYRLERPDGITFGSPVAPALETRYPEVESTVRIWGYPGGQLYSPVTDQLYLGDVWYADSTLFDIFPFQFVEGNPQTALLAKNNVVLSERFARKLFGTQSALGQQVRPSPHPQSGYTVSGVIRDLEHSHFRPVDIIYPMAKMQAEDRLFQTNFNDFATRSYATYVLARPGADLQGRTAEIPDLLREIGDPLFVNQEAKSVELVPLHEIYLRSTADTTGLFRGNSSTFIVILGVTTLLVLVFAMINYINLSVAQAEFRIKEAAVRRLLGQTREGLFAGFVLEALILCGVALLLGLGLAKLAEPVFRSILHTSVGLADGATAGNLVGLTVGWLVVGTVSGVVPAMVVSRQKPIDLVRGQVPPVHRLTFGKALIVFQYVIVIVLIGCTLTIGRQVRYMQTQDLGFESRCILGMNNNWLVLAGGQETLRNQLMAIPGVERVSFVRYYPTESGGVNEWTLPDGERLSIREFQGDTAFLSLMRFEVLHRTGVEDADGVWLNETAWRRLGLAPDASEYPLNSELKLKIKGRVRDFHFEDYTQPVGPAVISTLPSYERPYQILVQVAKSDPYGVRERIRQFNNRLTGGETFDAAFLDERIAAMYDSQRQIVAIIGTLSVVAVVLATLGMVAMAAHYTRKRQHEVAIRKVFGSTTPQVLRLVLGAFLKWVGLAFVVAVPIILQLMGDWLEGYAYRVSLSWTLFFVAGAVTFLIAGSTVLWQSWRVARTNPVEVLRK